MVSSIDLGRSNRAIHNGRWLAGHSKPNSIEGVTAELLAAILTELVAAREDRVVRRSSPTIKIGD